MLGASASAASSSAPADESFGQFKYTAISVRTKIDALGRSYRERWADDASIVHDAELVENSLMAWAQRYPKDPWLAPAAFHLAQLYAEIQTPQARAKAIRTFRYVADTYPATKQGRLARQRLRQGLPPLHGERAVSATPSPYRSTPAPAASPAAAPSASASPIAGASPSSSPAAKPPR